MHDLKNGMKGLLVVPILCRIPTIKIGECYCSFSWCLFSVFVCTYCATILIYIVGLKSKLVKTLFVFPSEFSSVHRSLFFLNTILTHTLLDYAIRCYPVLNTNLSRTTELKSSMQPAALTQLLCD